MLIKTNERRSCFFFHFQCKKCIPYAKRMKMERASVKKVSLFGKYTEEISHNHPHILFIFRMAGRLLVLSSMQMCPFSCLAFALIPHSSNCLVFAFALVTDPFVFIFKLFCIMPPSQKYNMTFTFAACFCRIHRTMNRTDYYWRIK